MEKKTQTTEEKARLFAQYWGQEVLIDNIGKKMIVGLAWSAGWTDRVKSYLELKPISSISDDHAIEVAKIAHSPTFTYPAKWEIMRDLEYEFVTVTSKGSYHSFDISTTDGSIDMYQEDHKSDNSINHYAACDYIRSKGYALPFMQYSVEEMIEFGWIVLTPGSAGERK